MSKYKYFILSVIFFMALTLNVNAMSVGEEKAFGYTGDVQEFVVPVSGYYKIELWGAQGGNTYNNTFIGGLGAYTAGEIFLKKDTVLYFYVGQKKHITVDGATFNGGKSSSAGYPAGGATDVRLVKGSSWRDFDSLKSRIMVAAGGGGGHGNQAVAGAGGGLVGKAGGWNQPGTQVLQGASQNPTSYGVAYFGIADSGHSGGNGYYPGGPSQNIAGSSGGSSFISGHNGCDAIKENSTSNNIIHTGQSIHYSGYKFINTVMIDGDGYPWTNVIATSATGMPTWNGTSTMTGNANNGYAKVTFLSANVVEEVKVKNAEIIPNSDVTNSYDVYIDGKSLDTEIEVKFLSTFDFISGTGPVFIETGKTYYVSAIDRNGDVIIIELNVKEKTIQTEISFDDMEFSFNEKVFNYNLNVDYSKKSLTPKVVVEDGATYEVSGDGDLRVGDNLILVTVKKDDREIVYKINVNRKEKVNVNQTFTFTGGYQTFVVPDTGNYMIELWGASGTGAAYGGYTKGTIFLEKDTTLYVYVGQKVVVGKDTSGFNAGTGDTNGYSGGGATDIRLVGGNWRDFNSLKTRIMVAAGGGTATTGTPGAAGGLVGYDGGGTKGATQTSGSKSQSTYAQPGFGYAAGGTNGGNGYYAAGGANFVDGAGGGSSFISGHMGCNAITSTSTANNIVHTGDNVHYSGLKFTNTVMIDGQGYSWSTSRGAKTNMPTFDGKSTMVGNNDNGYARITSVLDESDNNLLKSLKVTDKDGEALLDEEGNQITLDFEPNTFEYAITLNEDETDILIEAIQDDVDASVYGSGVQVVKSGTNDYNITVTAPNGSVQIYVLHITRAKSTNPFLRGIKINGISLEEFKVDTFNYEVTLPYYEDVVFVEGVRENENQTITGDGVKVLVQNEAMAELLVVSEDGVNNKLYKIHFTKEKTTLLNKITFNEINKILKLEDNKFDYNLDLTLLNHSLTLDVLPYYEGVEIKIEGNKYLGEKSKVITVTSSLEGLPDSVYTFNINYLTQDEKYSFSYPYTGGVQKFVAPASQYYDVELWGAQGGTGNVNTGQGGYTKGKIFLEKGTELFIYVGQMRTNAADTSTFNGGTGTQSGWPGGGATDIRLVEGTTWRDFDSLKSRIMVAAGGGTATTGTAGAAGGLVGYDGGGTKGATQTSSTPAQSTFGTGGFGFGGGGSGGGGGYYGAGGAYNANGSGGGSSFISGHKGSNAIDDASTMNHIIHTGQSIHYSGYAFMDTKMIDGKGYSWSNVKEDLQLMPKPIGGYYALGNGHQGNGYAKIETSEFVSNDNYLDSLVIKSKDEVINLSPTFEAWEQEFNVELTKEQSKINIEAVPKDLLATVMGTGEVEVAPGETEVEIVVTAQDGSTRTYLIHLTREADDDPYPENIKINRMPAYLCKVNSEYCVYEFLKTTTEYNINLPYAVREIEILVTPKSKWQTVNYYTEYDFTNNANNTPIETDGVFKLDDELTTIYVEVISEDGASNVVYTYNFKRDVTGNNNLESIKITNPDIAIDDFEPYKYEYYLTLPTGFSFDIEAVPERKDKTKVEIQNTTLISEPYKTSVNGLVQGMNNVIITVTAENGDTKTYILHIYKGYESDVLLNSLSVTSGSNVLELSPTFDNRINDYSISVGSDVTNININAVAHDVNGTTVTGTGAKTLKSGVNTFQIEVKSKTPNDDGEYDANIYNLTIYKDMSNNATIANITIDDYTLSPLYDKDVHEYYINLNNEDTSVNVNVVMEDAKATYTVRGNNNLNKAMNEIVVTGIAEDKSYVVYKIYAYKSVSDNNNLASLNYKIGDDFVSVPDFDKDKISYTLNVAGDTRKIEFEAISEDNRALVAGTGIYYLQTGSNIINIDVTSESGKVKTYSINVIRAFDDDTTLLLVTNNRGSEVIKQENLDYDYLIDVQYEVNTIEIKGTPKSSTSSVTGNGTYNLVPGDNMITLRVTSEAGTYKDYKVKVVRDLSNNDDLAFLYVREGGISPNFNRTTIYYDVKVPNMVTNMSDLHIEAIPEDENASFVINNPGGELEVGVAREVTVVVTAPNKIDTKTYTISITRQEDTTDNLALERLETNRGELVPTFSSDTLNYEITVENNITDIEITGQAFSDKVKIEGLGTYNLNVGKNLISVFVIGESGVQRDYQIVVTRKKSSDARLANLVIKGHVLSPTFDKDVENYSLNTSKEYLEFTTIKTVEDEATVKIEGNTSFTTGSNEVKIIVTAPDGETTKEYVINAIKAGSKNNNLASLEVEGYTLVPVFHKGVTFYAVDVPNNVNSIMITATAEDGSATISGDGLKTIQTGENYFDIVVTSEAETKKTYTVLVTRDASDNNYLASLYVSEGTLDKTFIKTENNYEVVVSYEVEEIELYGTLEDAGASVTGFETYKLNVGEQTLEILVTSESGKINIYNIKVVRESVKSAYLSQLIVENFALDPDFNKENLEYFITVVRLGKVV